MPARGLDFLVIGAPKAGTTSLHEYLRTHPQLFLPEAKEQHFFSSDAAYEDGWEAFAAAAFRGALPDQLLGKATPAYLGGPANWTAEPGASTAATVNQVTAARIAGEFPDVKLIVMLRDPVERAVSSYWQSVISGVEKRPIDVALEAGLSPEALESDRRYPRDDSQYVALGEYGRLLGGYLEHFPREQLFVGSTTVLASDPEGLLAALWRFLEVDESHRPPNLGARYNTRGTGWHSPVLSRMTRLVHDTPGLRRAWSMTPDAVRAPLRARTRTYVYRRENRTMNSDPALHTDPGPDVLARLRRLYEPDLAQLEELVGPVEGVTTMAVA